jgi:hypothetical protein
MNRRRAMFWMGFGLFSLAETLRADVFDQLAAKVMDASDGPATQADPPLHWRAAENNSWRWYEQEKFIDGKWHVTGITTPIHKQTGEAYRGGTGYLDLSTVPVSIRGEGDADETPASIADRDFTKRRPSRVRHDRDGRPPSRWLRSLHADELRIWLKTIDVPEAGVEGMTYLVHLTRDHSFDEANVKPLTIDEQAKLHAAAHFGY